MKKNVCLAIVFVLIFAMVSMMVPAALRPNVIVTGFSVNEGSAYVGKNFTLQLNLENNEPATCAESITTTIQSNFPLIMSGINTVTVGEICHGDKKTVSFPMTVDPTATGGFYQISVMNDYETTTLAQFSSTDMINLFVAGTPQLNAYVTNSDPTDVYAGDTATISISIQNDGGFQAQAVLGSLSADLPIEVSWANSMAAIGSLDAKQSKTANFVVEIPKDAAAKDYPMNLNVKYLDQNLVQQSQDFSLFLHVKKKALFETSDAGGQKLYQNQNSRTIKLVLKNTGTDTARKVKAKLLPNYPFSSDGSERYIDSLAPGESKQLDLTVDIDKDATPGTYGLDLLVDFEDAQGKDFQDTAKVSLTVSPKDFVRAVFIDYWFIWLLVLIMVFMVIRSRLTKKKKKN